MLTKREVHDFCQEFVKKRTVREDYKTTTTMEFFLLTKNGVPLPLAERESDPLECTEALVSKIQLILEESLCNLLKAKGLLHA